MIIRLRDKQIVLLDTGAVQHLVSMWRCSKNRAILNTTLLYCRLRQRKIQKHTEWTDAIERWDTSVWISTNLNLMRHSHFFFLYFQWLWRIKIRFLLWLKNPNECILFGQSMKILQHPSAFFFLIHWECRFKQSSKRRMQFHLDF